MKIQRLMKIYAVVYLAKVTRVFGQLLLDTIVIIYYHCCCCCCSSVSCSGGLENMLTLGEKTN